jgi:pyrroline-5-carboxylate reductase
VISIAAGMPLASYEQGLWQHPAVVRVMPNTPATVREGMSVCIGNAFVSDTHRRQVSLLLEAIGQVIWLDDESQMHAATALSGSGPAYLFYLLECLIEAGIANGLREEQARLLAIQTMCGTAALAAQSSETISQLRDNVTSPGGTTAAALAVLMKQDVHSLKPLVKDALAAAVARSIALS